MHVAARTGRGVAGGRGRGGWCRGPAAWCRHPHGPLRKVTQACRGPHVGGPPAVVSWVSRRRPPTRPCATVRSRSSSCGRELLSKADRKTGFPRQRRPGDNVTSTPRLPCASRLRLFRQPPDQSRAARQPPRQGSKTRAAHSTALCRNSASHRVSSIILLHRWPAAGACSVATPPTTQPKSVRDAAAVAVHCGQSQHGTHPWQRGLRRATPPSSGQRPTPSAARRALPWSELHAPGGRGAWQHHSTSGRGKSSSGSRRLQVSTQAAQGRGVRSHAPLLIGMQRLACTALISGTYLRPARACTPGCTPPRGEARSGRRPSRAPAVQAAGVRVDGGTNATHRPHELHRKSTTARSPLVARTPHLRLGEELGSGHCCEE